MHRFLPASSHLAGTGVLRTAAGCRNDRLLPFLITAGAAHRGFRFIIEISNSGLKCSWAADPVHRFAHGPVRTRETWSPGGWPFACLSNTPKRGRVKLRASNVVTAAQAGSGGLHGRAGRHTL